MLNKNLNPKFEYRNTKQIQNSNKQNSKWAFGTFKLLSFRFVLNFCYLNFVFVSCFGFRASDLAVGGVLT